MIERSKEIFAKLLQEVNAQSRTTYYWFMNEYNYRCGKFKEQYELGVERVSEFWNTKDWIPSGYYSQGVGAANYAKNLLLDGNTALALEYAQKAIVAWSQYFSYKDDYYNSYVHYAMALTILGYKNDAIKALDHAAVILKKDHVEFQEIRDFMKEVEAKGLVCFSS